MIDTTVKPRAIRPAAMAAGPAGANRPLPLRITMVVGNDCVTDSRVIKQATALAAEGNVVRVVCLTSERAPARERIDDVEYVRVALRAPTPAVFLERRPALRKLLQSIKTAGLFFKKIIDETPALPKKIIRRTSRLARNLLLCWLPVALLSPLIIVAWGPALIRDRGFERIAERTLAKQINARANIWVFIFQAISQRAGRPVGFAPNALRRSTKVTPAERKSATPTITPSQRPKTIASEGAHSIGRPIAFVSSLRTRLRKNLVGYLSFEAFHLSTYSALTAERPDVIHAHDLITLPVAASAAQATGAKLIYDSHELEMHRNAVYTPFVKATRARFERRAIRRCDAVITVSTSIAEHLEREYSIPRPHVIMNAPDFDAASAATRRLRHDAGVGDDTPLAVYVGSITINRGVEMLPEALAQLPDVHIAFVGPQRQKTVQELMTIAESHGVQDRIHVIPPVRPAEVVSYISAANVSVMPIQNVCLSYYYCFPNKLLESVFAGTPVVVSDLFELRNFVEYFKCGVVVDETSASDLAAGIDRILAEPDTYRITEDRMRILSDNYSWRSQSAKLLDIYGRLATSNENRLTSPQPLPHLSRPLAC